MRRTESRGLQFLHKGPSREVCTSYRRGPMGTRTCWVHQLRRAQLTFFASEVIGPRTVPGDDKSVAEDDKGASLSTTGMEGSD